MNDIKNNLLKRREIKFLIESEANPGFANATKMVADKFKAEEDKIVVKAVKSKFGRKTFLIDAFVYDSIKDKEFIEPKKKVKKAAGDAAGAK